MVKRISKIALALLVYWASSGRLREVTVHLGRLVLDGRASMDGAAPRSGYASAAGGAVGAYGRGKPPDLTPRNSRQSAQLKDIRFEFDRYDIRARRTPRSSTRTRNR